MNITITIPEALIPDTVEAFCLEYRYQEFILDSEGAQMANPESKAEFAQRMFLEYPRKLLRKYRTKLFKDGLAAVEAQATADGDTIVLGG